LLESSTALIHMSVVNTNWRSWREKNSPLHILLSTVLFPFHCMCQQHLLHIPPWHCILACRHTQNGCHKVYT